MIRTLLVYSIDALMNISPFLAFWLLQKTVPDSYYDARYASEFKYEILVTLVFGMDFGPWLEYQVNGQILIDSLIVCLTHDVAHYVRNV